MAKSGSGEILKTEIRYMFTNFVRYELDVSVHVLTLYAVE